MDDSSVQNKAIRVLIVDDQPIFRFGLRSLLGEDRGIMVVGEAACGKEACKMVSEAKPDVILLDPGGGDLECVASLRRACEDAASCRIIIYSANDERENIVRATVQGVNGYLMKDSATDELLRAIYTVHGGGTMLSPNIAAMLVKIFNEDAYQEPPEQRVLSNRELEVLSCLAEGRSNRSIAKKLFICEATVKFHVHAILGKLNVNNRTEAVLTAAQLGFINLTAH